MRVRIAPPDTASKFFDIVSPYRVPLRPGEILPWVLIVVIAGLLAWYAVRTVKRLRKGKNEPEPEIPAEPAHILAFRALEKLKEEQLWQNGRLKEYYTVLSEILRQYIEQRFGVAALELTTVETLAELKKSGFRDENSVSRLKSVLTAADLVKFAKFKPEPANNELQYENAWDFVSLTRHEELPVVEKADGSSEKEDRK